MSNSISFFLNGRQVVVQDPPVDTLLIDYLRSPEVNLAGPKKPCGQGGCGGCTVILSDWDAKEKKEHHRAINSCLRPLIAVDGMVVTTVEGTGGARRPNPEFLTHTQVSSRAGRPADLPLPAETQQAYEDAQAKRAEVAMAVEKAENADISPNLLLQTATPQHPSELSHLGMNPVAHRLAMNNGTQCGYCTVGFVMNMSEFIFNNPNATKKEIEAIFDGNICRCTGYRPILTGMKTFASDWTEQDELERMKCLGDEAVQQQLPAPFIVIPFPPEAKQPAPAVSVLNNQRQWLSPVSLRELVDYWKIYSGHKPHLVHANTSYGIYKQEFLNADSLIDISHVQELNFVPVVDKKGIKVSAGTTYSHLIDTLELALKKYPVNIPEGRDRETVPWGAVLFMAQRTAGRIVRNAATVGGNAMLVFKHIAAGTGEPFPSDLMTALLGCYAQIEYIDPENFRGQTTTAYIDDLSIIIKNHPDLAQRMILVSVYIPFGDSNDVQLAQKVALRDVNAHSIVNSSCTIRLGADLKVTHAAIVFGGLAPFPWRAVSTEVMLQNNVLSMERIPLLIETLNREVGVILSQWAPRMKGLPDEGFTHEYKQQLTASFLYKAIVKALLEKGGPVPPHLRSSGDITWGRWPVSNGLQFYAPQDFRAPVAQPYVKFTAMEQASGQLHYTHELPVPPNTVNAALVQSRRALADYHFIIPGKKGRANTTDLRSYLSQTFAGFVDMVTSEAFKNGASNMQGMGSDQPVFAIDQVNYVGQTIALVGAKTELEAATIAEYVADNCVAYTPVQIDPDPKSWKNKPVLSIDDALAHGNIYPDWPTTASFISHIWRITRPGTQLEWINEKGALDKNIINRTGTVDGNICQIVEGTQLTGGQVHFYMETQAAIAEPVDGGKIVIKSSTQSPMTIHGTIASALGAQYNSIDIQVPPVGGGFGGKTEQTRFVAAATAVAAKALKKPVKLALTREQDTGMIGKRHAYYAQYQVAIDKGETTPAHKGIIRGLLNRMWGDGGAFYDCSFIVSNCIITRADNAYRIPNFQAQIDVCRTNTAPSTAFRAFGDVQGKVMMENAIDDAAFSINMTAEEVRRINLYDRGDVTPFGQALSYCYMKDVWKYLKDVCNYDIKVAAVEEFNQKNKWRKQGLAIMPVKYGSGYNLTMLEQAGAMISVYQGDGSIIIHQGGVEMGQGLLTQVRQVASYILNVPMTLIEIESPKTSIVTNPTSTGASTGTTYSAEAVKRVCEQLRSRITEFGYEMLKIKGDDWCGTQGIDFWNYGAAGWQAKPLKGGRHPIIWQNLVAMAYQNRISLTCSLNIPIHGGEVPFPNITYKTYDQQPIIPGYESSKTGAPGEFDSFSGFTYSAACSVVEVDILTGETKILSSDIVYDAGWSMNQAIDIGQVEGAFVQGIGYVLSEKLVFEPDGPDAGRLNTLNTWTYKPPATTSIPLELNVHLFPRGSVNVPENPTDIMSAKEIGEPPLVLAASVFFAVKAAIRASRIERGLSGLFRFDSPATVQEVSRACEIDNNYV
ncbi:molybdopterin cofactor-binding domain-containing protein [Mucilaginibacter sp. 22184]|uniref:molybdopterin cofactor-binding domain-containing protein n=1 Tax=Mucilaginibacter sp. 22184 TaxID=3453887 RepID=UPI003F840178